MAERLDSDGSAVVIGGVTIRSPGLGGRVDVARPGTAGARAAVTVTPLDALLMSHDLRTQNTIVIDAQVVDTEQLRGSRGGRARGSTANPAFLEVEVDAPSSGWGQVLLVHDTGTAALTWSFAQDQDAPDGATRGSAGKRRYPVRVSGEFPDDADSATRRGITSMVVKKVIKVIAFKLAHRVLGELATHFAEAWEQKHRPYGLHMLGSGDLDREDGTPTHDDWRDLTCGRALLLVHGTFSTTGSGFGGLAAGTALADLRQRYGNRVFGFNHFTMSRSPVENVRWFAGQVPAGVSLELDVICHSRGGLVSRVLAENYNGSGLDLTRFDVKRLVFVAAPNAGTALADTDRMHALIDTYTNLFTYLPDNPVLDGISAVLEAVKDIAAAMADGLSGLMSMAPNGDFLKGLNRTVGTTADYFAIGADYEPAERGLRTWAIDRIADAAFRDAHNDLVVPSDGVYAANGSSRFPINAPVVFPTSEGISHCTYFGNAAVHTKLLEWLTPV